MKLKQSVIEMLTEGETSYCEIAQFLGISSPTAKSICRGEKMNFETARKIVVAFGDVPVRQLFRNPCKHFEQWLGFPEQQELRNNPLLSPAERLAIRQSLHRRCNRISTRRWRKQQAAVLFAAAA